LIERIADALYAAHQRRIVHRDLKPSNLFLRNGDIEQVTLLDFGIARRATLSHAMTRTGVVVGSPEYMAPEQARGQRDLGASADIFSLGCVLFECLAGRSPFAADIVAGVMAKILFEPPPPLQAYCPNIPKSLEQLVARMLEKDPALRPQDAGDLLQAMNGLQVQLSEAAVRGHTPVARARGSFPPTEQQLVSVMLAIVPSLLTAGDSDTGIASPLDNEPGKELARALAPYGSDVQMLADGSIVAMLPQRSHMAATDLAAQAARCALALWQCYPDSLSTLTTHRGDEKALLFR
jgi:serine/threonine protein kinase